MKTLALYSMLLAGSVGLFAQDQAPPPPPAGQALTPEQLNDLVAPIALYPDPLLSQVLVASTYPLEVVQALQWAQRNPGLSGTDLTAAAAQQNWDPSIQALVVFPDVLKRLNDDVTWTTTLGNAFVAQQQDVMDAVQRMRLQAQQAGKLASTPQENVTTDYEDGQPYVSIAPADPDVIYVPVYDPYWVWGAPRWYPYARWYYPPRSVIYSGVGFGFGGGIRVGLFFGSGWHGWGGWGWHPGWGNRTVIVNNTFVSRNNFNTARIGNVRGSTVWSHDSSRRVGVPYNRPAGNDRYRDNGRPNFDARQNNNVRPSYENRQNYDNRQDNNVRPNYDSRQNNNVRPSYENRQNNNNGRQGFENRQIENVRPNNDYRNRDNGRSNIEQRTQPQPAQSVPFERFQSRPVQNSAPAAQPTQSRPQFRGSENRQSQPRIERVPSNSGGNRSVSEGRSNSGGRRH